MSDTTLEVALLTVCQRVGFGLTVVEPDTYASACLEVVKEFLEREREDMRERLSQLADCLEAQSREASEANGRVEHLLALTRDIYEGTRDDALAEGLRERMEKALSTEGEEL